MDQLTEEEIAQVETVQLDAPPDPDAEAQQPTPEERPEDQPKQPKPRREERKPNAPAREASGEGSTPRTHNDQLRREVEAFDWDDQTREARRLCTALWGLAASTCDILDAPLTITDAEVEELGEAWGDGLRHFVTVKKGELKGDVMKALGETVIVGRQKANQIQRRKDG